MDKKPIVEKFRWTLFHYLFGIPTRLPIRYGVHQE